MSTRKDFIRAALMVKNHPHEECRDILAAAFADYFAAANPLFSRGRFYTECGIPADLQPRTRTQECLPRNGRES